MTDATDLPRLLPGAEVVAILRNACAAAGGQSAWAARHRFSPQYVCDVLRRRRDVSEALANALGLVREVRFRPLGVIKGSE